MVIFLLHNSVSSPRLMFPSTLWYPIFSNLPKSPLLFIFISHLCHIPKSYPHSFPPLLSPFPPSFPLFFSQSSASYFPLSLFSLPSPVLLFILPPSFLLPIFILFCITLPFSFLFPPISLFLLSLPLCLFLRF